MFKIQLKKLATVSIYENGVYSQSLRKNPDFSGTIDRALLVTILKLNLALLGPLATPEKPRAYTKEVISTLLKLIPGFTDKSYKVLDIDVTTLVKLLEEKFLSLAINDNVYAIYDLMRTYDDKYTELYEKIDAASELDIDELDDAGLQRVLDTMIEFNSVVLPRYTSSVYLCLITTFYAVFTKLDGNKDGSDMLVLDILFSHLQRIFYDTNTDVILMKYLGDKCYKNPDKFVKDGEVKEKSFYKFVRHSSSAITATFPRLRLRTPVKSSEMENMYNMKTGLMAIYSSYKLDPQLDIFPYVLHLHIPREDRMKVYVNARLQDVIRQVKDDAIKDALEDIRKSFDQIYDHILFPNRAKSIAMNKSIEQGSTRIFNLNNFSDNPELVTKLKGILSAAFKAHYDNIRK